VGVRDGAARDRAFAADFASLRHLLNLRGSPGRDAIKYHTARRKSRAGRVISSKEMTFVTQIRVFSGANLGQKTAEILSCRVSQNSAQFNRPTLHTKCIQVGRSGDILMRPHVANPMSGNVYHAGFLILDSAIPLC
jgi:hypothetical protein